MKKILLLIVCCLGLVSGGCLEMMTPAAVVEAKTKVEMLNDSVNAYQSIVSSAIDQMQKDKIISAKTAETVDKISAKVDELQPTVTDAVTAVIEAEYSGDKLVDIVTGIHAANEATAPVNPYAPLIRLITEGILVATTGGGIYAASKNKRALTEVVIGINDEAKMNGGLRATQKAAFNAAQSLTTRKLVKSITG